MIQDVKEIGDDEEAIEVSMSGCVKNVLVKAGDEIIAHQTSLCVIEAMKTEMTVTSDYSGYVVKVLLISGQQVSVGCTLIQKPRKFQIP